MERIKKEIEIGLSDSIRNNASWWQEFWEREFENSKVKGVDWMSLDEAAEYYRGIGWKEPD